MSKALIAGIIVLLLAVGGVGFVVTRPKITTTNNTTTASTAPPAANSKPNNSTAETTQNASTNAEQSPSVVMKDLSFSPSTITVKVGTKVTWTNQDTVKHDVSPDSSSDDFKASSLLGKGESYSFTFNKPGTYAYHCTPHPFMKATVVVTE